MPDQQATPSNPVSPDGDHAGRSILRELRNHLLTGLLIAAPLGVTWYICAGLFDWIDGLLREPIKAYLAKNYPAYFAWTIEYQLHGIGILGVLFFLIATGMLARNVVGRQLIRWLQRVLLAIPIVGWVYNASQQISEAIFDRKKGLFQRAVLLEFPRKGIWTLGFVTGQANTRPFQDAAGTEDLVFIFIPTTPNPTSGWLIVVPVEETHPLDITIDEAIKLVISGGVMLPPEKPSPSSQPRPHGNEQPETVPA